MISKKEIKKLSLLSRVAVDEKEIKELQQDLEKILNFISKLETAPTTSDVDCPTSDVGLRNIMREDRSLRKSGKCGKFLLEQAPKTERGFVKTRKVL